ncbi:MAG: hypothetical protein PVI90_17950 [Desulfobacteraceae bacterium]|jgi:hypothetical protein
MRIAIFTSNGNPIGTDNCEDHEIEDAVVSHINEGNIIVFFNEEYIDSENLKFTIEDGL